MNPAFRARTLYRPPGKPLKAKWPVPSEMACGCGEAPSTSADRREAAATAAV